MNRILLIVLGFMFQAIVRARHRQLNKRQFVVADWERLRITSTELIEGYKRRATRHSLRGLVAWVEQDEKRVYVVVEGPDTSVVGISNKVPWSPSKLPSAQEFAAALNLAARQQA
jgi:hypothetical protein